MKHTRYFLLALALAAGASAETKPATKPVPAPTQAQVDGLNKRIAELESQVQQQNAIINVLAAKRTDAENEAIKAEAQVALDHAQPAPETPAAPKQ